MQRTEQERQKEWIESYGFRVERIDALAGDVSQRSYSRVLLVERHSGKQDVGTPPLSAILSTYPEKIRDSCRRFEISTRVLELSGVRVPRILARDCAIGLMLLEDFGTDTLYCLRRLPWADLEPFFRTGVDLIRSIQAAPLEVVSELNPPLDGDLLRLELAKTWDLLFDEPSLRFEAETRRRLREALEAVCERIAAGRKAVCHRDFMARNLLPLDGFELGVLDHQDLRIGPEQYDLASLLNDSLFPPPEIERRLLDKLGLSPADEELYRHCAVQRTLKAAGTFAAFARSGVDRHLVLIPPTLSRAAAHLEQIPEGADLPDEVLEKLRSYRPP
ncbi:MAG: phosphotransferase [Acidobacteriota bacterium]|nr:phosphotransferase [Acidobacteriota bacterium]